jgi:hypothetical protein
MLASVCSLVAVYAAQAQPARPPASADNLQQHSHRLLGIDLGDISQAEDSLARRLHHTQDIQELQDLVKPLLADKDFQKSLMEKFKDVKPEEVKKLQEAVKNNPELLDNSGLRDLLKSAAKLQQSGDGSALSDDNKNELIQWAKNSINNQKLSGPSSGAPTTAGSPTSSPTHTGSEPAVNVNKPSFSPSFPPAASKSGWFSRDFVQKMTGLLKDVDHSPEGDALRAAALRDLVKMDSGPVRPSSGLFDFLKGAVSAEQASWLALNLRPPSMPSFDGWSSGLTPSAGPSLGAAPSADGLDGVVWIAAVALFGAAAWLAFRTARLQAAGARTKAWSAGPWPVRPSQVSTREDLIRAFEHLAFLCLGPVARTLNHLDVAGRLGKMGDGRTAAAARLAHLYEQARYAPPSELLLADELTAARGDLSALAGAAA